MTVWRYHVVLSISNLCFWAFFGALLLWLMNRVPFVPQVAWAADVQTVRFEIAKSENRLRDMELLQVRNNLSLAHKAVCEAQAAGNQTDLDIANGEFMRLSEIYSNMMNKPPMTESCSTILVGSH